MRMTLRWVLCLLLVAVLGAFALLALTEFDRAVAYVRARHGYVDEEGSLLFGRICLEVDWSHADVTDDELEYLVRLRPDSIRLDGNPRITDRGLSVLASITDMRNLTIRKTPVTSKGIREFQARRPFVSIRHNIVNVDANGGTPEVAAAAQLIWHHYVSVTTDENDAVIEAMLDKKHLNSELLLLLPALPHLERLIVPSTVTDDDLKLIGHCKSLRELNCFYATEITDAGVAELEDLHQLKKLALVKTAVTDRGVAFLAHLPNLTAISLDETAVGDRGAEILASMPRLEYVSLGSTRVTDAGLRHLEKLTNLKYLGLPRTGISPEAVASLKIQLPDCEIWQH